MKHNKQFLEVVDAFGDAALDGEGWYQALERLAALTGSSHGQLIGLGTEAAAPFNVWTVDPDVPREFCELGYASPELNPRVRAGIAAPELTVLADRDFITPEAARAQESYRWARSRGLSFICLSPLIKAGDMVIGLAVTRSETDGHVSVAEKRLFGGLALHVRSAVRFRMLFEQQMAQLLLGTMEQLSHAAFACDVTGRVTVMTPAAEAIIRSGRHLAVKRGRLLAEHPEDARVLTHALAAAAAPVAVSAAPLLTSVVLKSPAAPTEFLLADVIRLPLRALSFEQAPRVLVVVRGSENSLRGLTDTLRTAFGLTPAEADVALMLAEGHSPEQIAGRREVSAGTVRIQVKKVYQKLGVSRQAELVARLRPVR